MNRLLQVCIATGLALAMVMGGCTNSRKTGRLVALYDDSDPATSGAPSQLTSTPGSESANRTKDGSTASGQVTVYTVDGMVGQVNGQALYANKLLDPISDYLRALARRGYREERLEDEVSKVIRSKVVKVSIFGEYLLAEAKRDLNDRSMMGVNYLVRQQRAELVRSKGGGSPTIADIKLGGTGDGRKMAQILRVYRERFLIDYYMKTKVWIKINIRLKDIERYYRNNRDQYRSPAVWTVQIIQVKESTDADRIEGLFASGQSFAQAAKDPSNRYTAGSTEIEGGSRWPETLIKRMKALKVGEHTRPVEVKGANVQAGYWWVYVEKIEPGFDQSLTQAQPGIRERLYLQRKQQLQDELRKKLLGQISQQEKDQMVQALWRVAMSRYVNVP